MSLTVPTRSLDLGASLRKLGRVLTFRASREDLLSLNSSDLAVGLFFTWIAGMGRYWDNPKVEFLQKLGVGSVLYVFCLGLLLWVVIRFLRPKDWGYLRLVTFLTFTSPPGLIYAIPVQFWMSIDTANLVNAGFLLLVAIWRISLLNMFLKRLGGLGWFKRLIGIALPVMGIIIVLFALNLERVAYDFMSGILNADPNGDAYLILVWAMMITYMAFLPVLLAYCLTVAVTIGEAKGPPGGTGPFQEAPVASRENEP